MSESPLNLRARTKKGIIKIQSLNSKSTISELKKAISDLTGIELSLIKILKGYPPKPFDHLNENSTLNLNQIKNGELLTVEEDLAPQNKSEKADIVEVPVKKETFDLNTKLNGILLRKVVPANNSCLFTSVYFVMEDGVLNLDCQKSMRELIASTVKNNPTFYSEGILGKKNKDYCDWIRNSTSWGGCIECMILSKYYQCEICVVDIRTGRIDKFGEDCNYEKRVFVIYDGIHFDPLYLEPNDPANKKIQTRFSTKEEPVFNQAILLALEAKNARQYTDVANFKLRCLVCQQPLKGQQAAQDHAEKFGHINFGEI